MGFWKSPCTWTGGADLANLLQLGRPEGRVYMTSCRMNRGRHLRNLMAERVARTRSRARVGSTSDRAETFCERMAEPTPTVRQPGQSGRKRARYRSVKTADGSHLLASCCMNRGRYLMAERLAPTQESLAVGRTPDGAETFSELMVAIATVHQPD